jgi:tRNA threonylcarbamoyladenosine biosynthesis protein TsaB
MRMLAIETSSLVASVAVVEDDLLLADFVLQHPMTHSQKLMPMLENALTYLGLTIPDFDAIAVTIGPGSFTGLRIGVSAAKGLAQPFGIGVIPVSSLRATAYNAYDSRRIVAVMMDARRNEYYAGAWKFGRMAWQPWWKRPPGRWMTSLPDFWRLLSSPGRRFFLWAKAPLRPTNASMLF